VSGLSPPLRPVRAVPDCFVSKFVSTLGVLPLHLLGRRTRSVVTVESQSHCQLKGLKGHR
jgi:hypothetical protein